MAIDGHIFKVDSMQKMKFDTAVIRAASNIHQICKCNKYS